MFTATKIFKVPIGHRLSLHKGRCINLHGHNLKIEIEIERGSLNENFMVIDFYDLKRITSEVLDRWDHSLLLNATDAQINYEISKKIENQRTYYFDLGDPTSENMCFVLYNILFMKFKDFDKELRLKSITIWESDESKATYMVD